MHKMAISDSEVAGIASGIADACDGHHVVAIMAAMSDILAAIVEDHAEVTMDDVLADFTNVARQRHGDGTAH